MKQINRVKRAAKRGTKQILTSGYGIEDLRVLAAAIKECGTKHHYRGGAILRSEVDGMWYQYWKVSEK